MVEPDALLVVKLGPCLAALGYVEQLAQLVEAVELALGAGVPAQQREEVDHGLGEVALLAEARRHLAGLWVVPFEREYGEAEAVAVALAELALALGLEQQRQVGEAGHGVGPAECLVEQHVERRAGQPLLAADDVGYLHQVVVHDVGQVVCGQFVGALVEHLVVYDVALDAHLAAYDVVDEHLASRLHAEAHHVLRPLGHEPLHFLLGHGERVAHREARVGVVLEVLHLLALGLQLLGRVERHVCLALVEQLAHVLLVYVAALALAVWAVVASEGHAFVELDAEPAERLYDIFLCAGHEPAGVCVFDSEHEVAAPLAGKHVVVKRGAYAADVQGPRGAGRESHPYFSLCHYNKMCMCKYFCAKLQYFFHSSRLSCIIYGKNEH